MESFEIRKGKTYAGKRWKGNRQVVDITRQRGEPQVVHYIDLRTLRTGNAPLVDFANGATGLVEDQPARTSQEDSATS